jgi:biotin transport system substrate-specific component
MVTDHIAPRTRAGRIAAGLGLSVLFAGLTVVGANIVIPIQPVPITLQTLFVLLAGACIGRGWGTLSQSLYVGLGALGLPLFAGGAAGWALLGGPTGGYLIAFVVAPFIVAALLRRSASLAGQIVAFSAGTLVILAMGVAHLTLFYTHDFGHALTIGLLPFVPGAIVKIAAAVSIYGSSQALARHRRDRPTDA